MEWITEFIGVTLSVFFVIGLQSKLKIIVFILFFITFAAISKTYQCTEYWWFNLFIIPSYSFFVCLLINLLFYKKKNGKENEYFDSFIKKHYGLLPTEKLIEELKITMSCTNESQRGFFALLISYVYYSYGNDIDNSVKYAKMAMYFVDAKEIGDLVMWYRWIANTEEIASRISNK